jgi:hypothetical protein
VPTRCPSFADSAVPSSSRALEPFAVVRSLKVEDNPNQLIYFLNHVLNLAIYRCNIDAIWRFVYDFRDSIYTCNQNQTPRQYFKYAYDFIILKMNTVAIHYRGDFSY